MNKSTRGKHFVLETVKILDEFPDTNGLLNWYEVHVNNLVNINRLEGVPEFCFQDGVFLPKDAVRLAEKLLSTEQNFNKPLSADKLVLRQSRTFEFGPGSATILLYKIDGKFISILYSVSDWVLMQEMNPVEVVAAF